MTDKVEVGQIRIWTQNSNRADEVFRIVDHTDNRVHYEYLTWDGGSYRSGAYLLEHSRALTKLDRLLMGMTD
jgi:hypothetical protein